MTMEQTGAGEENMGRRAALIAYTHDLIRDQLAKRSDYAYTLGQASHASAGDADFLRITVTDAELALGTVERYSLDYFPEDQRSSPDPQHPFRTSYTVTGVDPEETQNPITLTFARRGDSPNPYVVTSINGRSLVRYEEKQFGGPHSYKTSSGWIIDEPTEGLSVIRAVSSPNVIRILKYRHELILRLGRQGPPTQEAPPPPAISS